MDRSNYKNIINLSRLRKGQILARRYIGFGDRLPLRLGAPPTIFAHYAVFASPTENYADWMTFNSTVGSSMELVPLSLYKGQIVRIYSVKNGDEVMAWGTADRLLSDHVKYEGLRGWNYVLRILPVLFKYWLLQGPKRIPWNKLPNVDSPDRVNCLVMIRRCYPNLISDAVCASAGAFEQAFLNGKLILEQEGLVP